MSAIVFVTRTGCLICAAGLVLVEAEVARRVHDLSVVDVDESGLQARFGDRVPVVLRDGTEVLSGRFDRRQVRRALR